MNNTALYNTDETLWLNYGKHLAETSLMGSASVVIHEDGTVSNGISYIARFSSRRSARKTLTNAGWTITPQLGMGCAKRNLCARVRRANA